MAWVSSDKTPTSVVADSVTLELGDRERSRTSKQESIASKYLRRERLMRLNVRRPFFVIRLWLRICIIANVRSQSSSRLVYRDKTEI